ncbi:MAG: ABC transporter permease [Spirochaetaceae bacterium]|jgi:osmoprotectant transport system permease protein|nr:ABC transporter permease [Spirochaetaceae bacterium]
MQPFIDYFSRNGEKYLDAVFQHLAVSGFSLALAVIIALPLGISAAKNEGTKTAITGLFAALRIVPSLAVLFVCVPLMGTGLRPAVTALSLLAIPPILINTTLAFSSIPEAVLETARGMGMSAGRIFFWIKAPLSLPLVLAGVKTAAVEIIASATLAAYIGGGGLGTIIFTGLGLMRNEFLLIGGVSIALLSIAADFILTKLENFLTRILFGGNPLKSAGFFRNSIDRGVQS